MLEKLSHLHRLCFLDKNWTAADFEDLQRSGAEVIFSDNSFIVWRVAADEAEIITIGVAPDARRTGTATALLRIMENEVRKVGVKKIFLEVAVTNQAAIGLYKRAGFTQVGTRSKYYLPPEALAKGGDGVDGAIMQKDL